MFNPRKIGFAALAALLILPAGAGAVYAASSGHGSSQAAVAPAHPAAGAKAHDDAETPDDNEPKGAPDTDNVQDGPGDTAEGPESNKR
jgi:hypothetical protein